jgi:hypothetical protein
MSHGGFPLNPRHQLPLFRKHTSVARCAALAGLTESGYNVVVFCKSDIAGWAVCLDNLREIGQGGQNEVGLNALAGQIL